MISTPQRKVIIDNYVRGLLNADRCDKNYAIIEKLWEASGLTNRDLVDELLSDRENASENFKDSIFWDMIWILKEAITEDDALRNLFCDLFAKRYPKVEKYVTALEEKIQSGNKVLVSVSDYEKFYRKNNIHEVGYFLFRIYNSDIIVQNDCIDQSLWQVDYGHAANFAKRETDLLDDLCRFTDGNHDLIFNSNRFQKYVVKQKQLLADYLNVDVDGLSDFYDSVMTIQEDKNNNLLFNSSGFGLISSAALEILRLHGGTSQWLIHIQSLDRKDKLSYHYMPDFDELFERYCKALIRLEYLNYMNNGENFTALTLARECNIENMEALAESMGFMYICDCIYQLYAQMQKQYYEDFSWEKYHNRDLAMRYEGVINDLKSSLAIRDHQLQNLRLHYSSLRDRLEKKNDLVMIKELQDKERLLRLSDEKDAEIERLKSVIATQNQLISQLQTIPAESTTSEDNFKFDVDNDNIIYHHKYLFVGDITALGFEELRRKFPSSIFMESNTANISQIQVDAVVYLIQSMSHSMFYKCKNTPALQKAKVVYFNGRRNLLSLFEAMEREMLNDLH